MAILTEADVRRLVARQERELGTKRLAATLGVSESYVINIRQGRKGIGPRILAALQLETVYRETVR